MSKDISDYSDLGSAWYSDSKKTLEKVKKQIKELTPKLAFNLDATLYFKPIEELMKLYDKKRYFEGLVLSCTYFRRIALSKLREYAKSNEELPISSTKIKEMGLTLDEILVILRISEKIDNKTYNDMNKIRDFRNELVHNPDKIKELEDDPEKAKKLFQNSIRCIDRLRKKKL